MSINLDIMLTDGEPTEKSVEESREEHATCGLFVIRSAYQPLTEGFDFHANGHRDGPLVSGYHAAEWFLWNWWRLRWEPQSYAADWGLAHRMPSIGEGYVWPDITIFSDGVRTALVSEPSVRPDAVPFRYTGSRPVVVPSVLWENAVDGYVTQIIDRLRASEIGKTNVDRLKEDIEAERADRAVSEYRRLEAMLGLEPDSGDDDTIERLIADGDRLGSATLGEIAASCARASAREQAPMTAREFGALAQDRGYCAVPRDAVELAATADLPPASDVPAWRLGVAAAQALREQERLGESSIDNERLAQMAGVDPRALTGDIVGQAGLSFMLDENEGSEASRLVMRPTRPTGRRFDLARLIGDRLVGEAGALRPATKTKTYRQKAQRAFAAEFLSPFEAVEEMLGDDHDDDEFWNEIAEHFRVSPRVIEMQLINHDKLERDFKDPEFRSGHSLAA